MGLLLGKRGEVVLSVVVAGFNGVNNGSILFAAVVVAATEVG